MPFKHLPPPPKRDTKRSGMPIDEAYVESDLIKKCKELGWECEKFTSPQKRSVPDRICGTPESFWFPCGLIFFVELKRPFGQATDNQLQDHARRRAMGHLVFVCDCEAQIDSALDIVKHIITTGVVVELPIWLML